jgi:hypothetical protein
MDGHRRNIMHKGFNIRIRITYGKGRAALTGEEINFLAVG